MSIALAWCDFKTYCEAIGPGRAHPPRPAQCVFCDGTRVWFNGWRRMLPTLLVDGRPHRPTEWVALQLVRCARRECRRSWTLRPPWLYPHRSLEPDLAEAAALAYLLDPQMTYTAVAAAFGCAWITVAYLGHSSFEDRLRRLGFEPMKSIKDRPLLAYADARLSPETLGSLFESRNWFFVGDQTAILLSESVWRSGPPITETAVQTDGIAS